MKKRLPTFSICCPLSIWSISFLILLLESGGVWNERTVLVAEWNEANFHGLCSVEFMSRHNTLSSVENRGFNQSLIRDNLFSEKKAFQQSHKCVMEIREACCRKSRGGVPVSGEVGRGVIFHRSVLSGGSYQQLPVWKLVLEASCSWCKPTMTASPVPVFSAWSCFCVAAGLMLSFLNESPAVVKRVTQNSSFTSPSSEGWKSISSTVSEHKYLSLGFLFCSSWVISLSVRLLRWQVYTSLIRLAQVLIRSFVKSVTGQHTVQVKKH